MKTPGPSKQFEAPKQHWPAPATPPGSPNIVLMMLDDVGFADWLLRFGNRHPLY